MNISFLKKCTTIKAVSCAFGLLPFFAHADQINVNFIGSYGSTPEGWKEVVSLSPLARQGQQQQHRRVEATGDLLPIPGGFKLMPSTNVMEVQDGGENGLN